MNFNKVCILGGTGFVGKAIASTLAKHNIDVHVLTRNRERHRELLVLPNVKIIKADIHDPNTLVEQFSQVDAVINLVGVLHDRRHPKDGFQSSHVLLARKILDACQKSNIRRILHMSALNADSGRGTSQYLRSKGEAENIIHNTAHIAVTSFRPSVVFGPGDSFLNRFASMLRMSPAFLPFILACPNTRFAPIYVQDLAECFVRALNNKTTYGKHYDLCGPGQYTLKQLVTYTAELMGSPRYIIGLNHGLSKLLATIMEMLPGKLFTLDNYDSMKLDSVCNKPFPEVFGLQPTALEAIAPGYISNKNLRHRFIFMRQSARR